MAGGLAGCQPAHTDTLAHEQRVSTSLVVLNPRRIPECMAAFEALPVRKVYVRNWTERQIADNWDEILGACDADKVLVVSDDALVSRGALDSVLGLLEAHPVATGWCPLAEGHELANLATNVLREGPPNPADYEFVRCDDVRGLVATSFAGMCLTGMSRGLWGRFPFECYSVPGFASDYHLSYRLQQAGVPIVSHGDARCEHVKAVWNVRDRRWPLMCWPEAGVFPQS